MKTDASTLLAITLAMHLPLTAPSWASLFISITLFLIPTTTSIPHTPPPLSLSLSLSLTHPHNTTTLTTWPPTPFFVLLPLPNIHPPTTLSFLAIGPTQSASDKTWLLSAIAIQQSVYSTLGGPPQNFNIWNEQWRFYMVLGQRPLTMAMAVETLRVYRGLVEAWGMAEMAFVVRVGEEERGFYWVVVNDGGEGVEV